MPLPELSQADAGPAAEETFRHQPGGPESWGSPELAATLDAASAPIWVLDPGGRCLFINQAATRMTGYSRDESIGEYLHCRIHKCHTGGLPCPESECRLQQCLHTGTGARIPDEVCWRRDGSSFAADYSIQPLMIAGRLNGAVVTLADITERRRALEKSLLDEEWFTVTTNAAGVGVCYREAGQTVASEEQFHLYGLEAHREWLTREEWLGSIHPDDRQRVAEEQERASRQERPHQIEFRVIWPDGSVHWLFSKGRVLLDEDGKPLRRVEITVDITDRRQVEGAFREFFAMSPSPLAIWGFDGRIKLRNPAWEQILGFSQEEAAERTVMDYVHPQDRAAAAAALEKVIRTGREMRLECRCQCKDGSYRWLMVNGSASKEARVIYATAQDITERKQTEETLREIQRRVRLIAETIDEVFWMSDVNIGRILYISPAYERIWGRPCEELYADPKAFLNAIHPDDRERVVATLEVQTQGLPFDHQYRIRCADGSIAWIWDRGFPIPNDDGTVQFYAGVAQDISVRKGMEEALRLHAEKLAQSNAELERFAYVASHDLQEPLRMVASFTKLLSDRYSGKLDETADRYIHFAVDGARRMQQLIADLLAYSRVNNKELDLRTTECEVVVLGAVENLRVAIEESSASLEWDPLPTLVADPRQLSQLFQNLLGNAIKFRGNPAPRVRISVVDEGCNWRFSVRDNGIGIDPRQADRIFQVFQRLHGREEYPGSGIGLAICKKVVERHGGRIWVEAEPGAGSDFRFTLPKRSLEGGAHERQ